MLLTLISNHRVCFALLTVLPHLNASDEASVLKCKHFGWFVWKLLAEIQDQLLDSNTLMLGRQFPALMALELTSRSAGIFFPVCV